MLDRSGVKPRNPRAGASPSRARRRVVRVLLQLGNPRLHVGVEIPGERHDPAGQVLQLVAHDSDDDRSTSSSIFARAAAAWRLSRGRSSRGSRVPPSSRPRAPFFASPTRSPWGPSGAPSKIAWGTDGARSVPRIGRSGPVGFVNSVVGDLQGILLEPEGDRRIRSLPSHDNLWGAKTPFRL